MSDGFQQIFFYWSRNTKSPNTIYFQILAFFCIVCSAPAYYDSQHWFLAVVVVSFIGTIFFSLYYLCLAEPLSKLQINWLMVEFWFTAGATFFYFTAFVSILTGFVGYEDKEWQYWIDANIAAGVSLVLTSREREILGNLAGDCTNIPIRRSF